MDLVIDTSGITFQVGRGFEARLALIIHGGRWVEFGPHCGDLRLRF